MSSYSDYAEAVGRLMQQQGDISARAELAKGNARAQAQVNNAAGWGNAVNQITHTLTNIPAQQAQAKELQLREQEQALRNKALQGQVTAAEQQRLTSQQANQIVATFPRNPDNTYNVVGIQGKLAQIGIPLEQQKGVLDVIEGMNKIATSFNASKIDHAADAAHLLISQHPAGQPWAWADVQLSAAGLKPTGLVSDEDQKLIDQAAESGANPEAFLKAMRDKSEKYKDYDKRTAETAKAQSEAQREALITAGTGPTGITAEKQATLDQTTATARTNAEDKTADNLRADDAAKRLEAFQKAQLAMQAANAPVEPVMGADGVIRYMPRSKAVGQQVPPPKDAAGAAGPKLTGSQQEDLATMLTVQDLSREASALGEKIGWKGVGGMGAGSVSQTLAKNFGTGTSDEQELRNKIGNIQGTIAKLRGGTSFTPNEQALLETYTPTINDSDTVIKSKLKSLGTFIDSKRRNTLKVASGDFSPNAPAAEPPPNTVAANAPAATPAVGSTVTYNGKQYRVKEIRNKQAVLEPLP